jgi:phage terminase small subunit
MTVKLTNKQNRFVYEYLVDCNATQAAIRAGYSPSTAGSIGFENLKKPEIRNEIKMRLETQSELRLGEREAIIRALFREAMNGREDATATSRVSALDKLARINGLYQAQIHIESLGINMLEISKRNAKERVSLLPKDNIAFDGGDDE